MERIKEVLRNNFYALGEEAYILNNGDVLVNDYGKYTPGLTLLVSPEEIDNLFWRSNEELAEGINVLWDGKPQFRYGEYFLSKKGTKCFRIREQSRAKHIIVRVDWGGASKRTRGPSQEDFPGCLYYRRASSNGGGTGYTYVIIPMGYRRSIGLDDI